jgi:DNA-binding response OmpR family regulator
MNVVNTETLQARRILVIDDEEANLLLLQTILEREGFTSVRYISDPLAAVDTLLDFDPHLVLLDLMMPGLDGYQLLDAFRRQTLPLQYRPVLILTADTTIEARRRALALGAKDFLSKPFDVIEIALRIANLLETQILYEQLSEHSQ